MKLIYFTLMLIMLFNYGCKSNIVKENYSTQSDRLNMIVKDYYERFGTDIEKYKLFSLRDRSMPKSDQYLYKILPMNENSYMYVAGLDDLQSDLPSGYIKYKERIFFIEVEDRKERVGVELLKYLDSLKLLDSTDVKLELGLIKPEDITPIIDKSDDSKEAVHYIICKKKPLEIRERLRSSVYLPPDSDKFSNLCN